MAGGGLLGWLCQRQDVKQHPELGGNIGAVSAALIQTVLLGSHRSGVWIGAGVF